MKLLNLTLVTFCLSLPLLLTAQNFRNEIGLRSDNDAYLAFGRDRYYTNGLYLTFRQAGKIADTSKSIQKKIWEVEIGQSMFNAQSGAIPDVKYVDRPFAAYLYGGLKLKWFLKNDQVLQASANVGTIGPAALGEDAQELLHKIVGFYDVNGWQYQVNNEIGVNTEFEYMRLLVSTSESADFTLRTTARLGTTFSGAGAGILFRAGSINRLSNSASAGSRISADNTSGNIRREFFFFAQPSLNFVAYDATVQGGMFRDDKGPITYSPTRLRFSQELGACFADKRWTVSFSVTFSAKDTKIQRHSHQFGTVGLFYRFGK